MVLIMSQLTEFLEKAENDNELMEKLDELGRKEASDEEIISLASNYGFTITNEEIEDFKTRDIKSIQINESELASVSGGFGWGSLNMWDPDICPTLGRTRFECVGFLEKKWCNHYRKWQITEKSPIIYLHECAMGSFKYYGDGKGNPR